MRDEAGGKALLTAVGSRVREARRESGLTQHALAERSGVSVRFLGQIEAGEGNVSLARLSEVALALGRSLPSLLGEEEHTERLCEELRRMVRAHGEAEVERALSLASSLLLAPQLPRVALLGMRGAGKTTVGERVARRCKVPFVELDSMIERQAALPLPSVFELHGEAYYRRLEHEALQAVLTRPGFVVATGGSLVTDPDEYALLQRSSLTVWLRSTPEEHWARVVAQGDLRPMRGRQRAMEELRALFEARRPLYEQAKVVIDTTGRPVDEVVDELSQAINKTPRAT